MSDRPPSDTPGDDQEMGDEALRLQETSERQGFRLRLPGTGAARRSSAGEETAAAPAEPGGEPEPEVEPVREQPDAAAAARAAEDYGEPIDRLRAVNEAEAALDRAHDARHAAEVSMAEALERAERLAAGRTRWPAVEPDPEPVPEPVSDPDPEPEPERGPADAADTAEQSAAAWAPALDTGEPAPPPYAPSDSVAVEDEPGGGRPELLVGAAFAGGLALALILRRLRS